MGDAVTEGGRENGLVPRKAAAIRALVSGLSAEQTAAAVGVTSRTIRRWQADPSFRSALVAAQDEAVGLVAVRLQSLGEQAVAILAVALQAAGQPGADASKSAALALQALDRIGRWREVGEIERRLREIEARLGGVS